MPYWDWAADGDLDPQQQTTATIWDEEYMGGQGNPVTAGPSAFDAADPNSWRVKLEVGVGGRLRATDRGLRRRFAQRIDDLPGRAQVAEALKLSVYDAPPWDTTSSGFRNQVEGWRPLQSAPGLHNRVHVWVGGDMVLSTSPNDPIFYLNHCNEDRIWSAWQAQPADSPYVPDQNASPSC